MSKEIWLGPVLGTNRERLLARCAEYIARGQADRLLYIAASHPLLDLVTERLLDGKDARGVWGEFPVYLFRGFVRRVLSSATVSEARPSGRASVATEPLLTRGLLTHALDEGTRSTLAPRVAIDREELPLRKSLISQIIKQLGTAGTLKAIRPLANRDGCVNTIASLVGELQRAGKTPEEFLRVIDARADDYSDMGGELDQLKLAGQPRAQADFDREVGIIYSAYVDALDRHGLTDDDADQLRALQILRGEIDGQNVSLPWLEDVELLVLDGFFDFTPVQGEMLRRLIPTIPNVIVNLNGETHNEEIFRPFQSTIEHFQSITEFKTDINSEVVVVSEELRPLRERLFSSSSGRGNSPTVREGSIPTAPAVLLLECGDREVEIRSIAREIKRLILEENYKLSEVVLVLRERAAYAEAIARVCAEESIPCNLERRVEAVHVPAVRACGKLFQLLREPSSEDLKNPKASDLAHLLKTGYFRVSPQDMPDLIDAFNKKYSTLLENDEAKTAKEANKSDNKNEWKQPRSERLRADLGIGRWLPDVLENAIAYVGTELRVDAWLDRAERLIKVFPSPEAARSLIAGNDQEDPAALAQDEAAADDAAPKAKRKRPAPVHPAAIAWTMLVVDHLRQQVATLPSEGPPEKIRDALMLLLDRLEFSRQVSRPLREAESPADVPQATLDVRGLESLRRALAAAVRSFNYAADAVSEARPSGRASNSTEPLLTRGLLPRPGQTLTITLSSFVDEVERSLRSQVLAIGAADRDGLRVLEATDVRGLRFRAVFIAGMIEGGFPLRTVRDWLYPHEERERLKKYGVVLEDISTDTLLKEEHYFYQAACRATDRLYLTRPLATTDGNETVASYYIEELKRAIAPAELQTEQVRGDIDTQDLVHASSSSELSTLLVRQSEHRARDARRNVLTEDQLKELLARARSHEYISDSALRRVDIERERDSPWFGPFDGEISNADLKAMLARHFGAEHVYSASGLSMYGNCSYRFFASRVLRLEPRNEAALDLQAIDAGKLLHDILRRFFERHRNHYLPDLDRAELRTDLAKVADQVFDEHETMVPPLNRRIWEIDREIRKLILDQVLLYELRLQERTNERGIRPRYFELAFGRASQASDPGSSLDYLKLERETANAREIALVQGQIDRVDVNEQEKVAVAYDYKLSQGAKLEDIEAGRQVQIPIYLAALEQLFLPKFDLAGGGYYRLRGSGSRLNQGLYRAKFADCTSVTSNKTKLDEIEWQRVRDVVQKRVWEFIDGMRAGDFRVRPSLGKETCKFCDYAPVCRYDTYRISRKRS